MIRVQSIFVGCALGLIACGGAPPPKPAEPSAPPKTEAKPEAPPATSEKPAEANKPAEPPKEEPRARKAAKDILLVPGWDFVISFADSDLKSKAEEECKKKAKSDDEDAIKDCMTKARAEAANDRLKFTTDDAGNWWFISMGKNAGKEIIYSKFQFKVAKEETDKLVLTPVGKDSGKRPIKKLPSEFVVEMPDEYSVVIQHPDRGKLVYSVKVSGDTEPKPLSDDKKAPEKKP